MLLLFKVVESKPVRSFCSDTSVALSGVPDALIPGFASESDTQPLASFSDTDISVEILTWVFKIVLDICCVDAKDIH